jgi:hypothetical protein
VGFLPEVPKWLIVLRIFLAGSGIDFDVSTCGHHMVFFKKHKVCLSRIAIYDGAQFLHRLFQFSRVSLT